MTLNHCFKAKTLILAAALFSGLGLVTHATAQERSLLVDLNSETVTELGSLGGESSRARPSMMPGRW
ncbi:hypothetical protein [Nitrosospira briensis]|uniref:hypothetical protein n=1 Tax=Nitrosospira briensis TaxID=35799 RepID=UPI0012E208BB|nr:hypothetical protein [Nitrosospira briensis]